MIRPGARGAAWIGAALTLALAGCQAPAPDPLWSEDLEVEVAGWSFNDANLVLALRVEAPAELPQDAEVDLELRMDTLSLPDAPFDPGQGKVSHRLLDSGVTAIEFKSRLLNPGLVPERELQLKAALILIFRGPARVAGFSGWTGGVKAETPWEHPQVPGLRVRLERIDEHAVSFALEGGAGGRLELALRSPGRLTIPVEEVRMGNLVRLEFLEPCPSNAELLVAWRPERRCRGQLEVLLSDPED